MTPWNCQSRSISSVADAPPGNVRNGWKADSGVPGSEAAGLRTVACLAVVAVAGCAGPTDLDQVGVYERTVPAHGTLRLTHDAEGWMVQIAADSPPRGSATAAPCEFVGRSQELDAHTTFHMVPFEGQHQIIDTTDLAETPRTLVLTRRYGGLVVEQADTFGFCGLHADIEGEYRPR